MKNERWNNGLLANIKWEKPETVGSAIVGFVHKFNWEPPIPNTKDMVCLELSTNSHNLTRWESVNSKPCKFNEGDNVEVVIRKPRLARLGVKVECLMAVRHLGKEGSELSDFSHLDNYLNHKSFFDRFFGELY